MPSQPLYAREKASTDGPERPSKGEQAFGDWLNSLKLKSETVQRIIAYAGSMSLGERAQYEKKLEAAFGKIAEIVRDQNFEQYRRVDTASITDPHDGNREVKVVGVTISGAVIEITVDRTGKRIIKYISSDGSVHEGDLEGLENDNLQVGTGHDYFLRSMVMGPKGGQVIDKPVSEIIALAREEHQYVTVPTPPATQKAQPEEEQKRPFGFKALHDKRKAQT